MKKPNIPPLPRWAEPLAAFVPGDAREAEEQRMMLETIARLGDTVLTRECALAHMTASSIIVSPARRRGDGHPRAQAARGGHRLDRNSARLGARPARAGGGQPSAPERLLSL